MAKTINTNINFGYDSIKTDWVGIEDNRTYPSYAEGWWGANSSYYEICWHRLSCGNCMLTGLPCKHYGYGLQRYEITWNTKTED